MEWEYWRKVLIFTLSILVVILAYRKMLRWVGGNSRFDDKFAFLFPLEVRDNLLLIKFELPEADTVSLSIVDEELREMERILEDVQLAAGTHEYEVDVRQWSDQRFTCILRSGNQTTEKFFRRDKA